LAASRDAGPGAARTDWEVALMQAKVGDRLHVHGKTVGQADRLGQILEVHGSAGEPPYLVRFEDGHTCLVFPGPDAVIEHPASAGAPSR
jgi:Domain of unknown function (DUF1918)